MMAGGLESAICYQMVLICYQLHSIEKLWAIEQVRVARTSLIFTRMPGKAAVLDAEDIDTLFAII